MVGYGSVALIKEQAERSSKAPEWKLSQQDRDELMRIAKRSVETTVREGKLCQCSTRSEAFTRERGAFVTLTKGQLRGCIGYVAPLGPLCLTVRDVAGAAAVRDPRFSPVSVAELGELEYEISVLSPLRRVTDIKQIQVGQHGLVMKNGGREGLLLPQVPTEEGWDRKTCLEQTCVKVGLRRAPGGTRRPTSSSSRRWCLVSTELPGPSVFRSLIFEGGQTCPASRRQIHHTHKQGALRTLIHSRMAQESRKRVFKLALLFLEAAGALIKLRSAPAPCRLQRGGRWNIRGSGLHTGPDRAAYLRNAALDPED